jgi:hypothetical protein
MESQKYKQSVAGPLGNGIDVQGSNVGQGPVGWWPMDEGTGSTSGISTTTDLSGNGNTGTWFGTASGTNGTYYSQGKVGSWAGYLNGLDDYIALPNVKALGVLTTGANIGTVTFWAKGASSTSAIITNDRSNTGSGDGSISINSNGTLQYTIDTTSNPPYLYSAISVATSTTSTWNFYAVTFSLPKYTIDGAYSGTVTLSVNGTTEPYTLNYTCAGTRSNFTALNIGRHHNYTWDTEFFPGLIDDVRIYNRALSAAEIQAIYNTGK